MFDTVSTVVAKVVPVLLRQSSTEIGLYFIQATDATSLPHDQQKLTLCSVGAQAERI